MEPLLPQLHQSSPQTKSKSRASISLLSIIWLAITAAGITAISRATVVVHQRALLQTNADAIALASANHGDDTARRFADAVSVHVVSMTRHDNTVTVLVMANHYQASATATDPM